MDDKNCVCTEFGINGGKGICNAYKELSLLLYPSLDETRTFCKTENYEKCPIFEESGVDCSVCV
ncbi:MAG: hypothetical protein Q6358_14370 [Candidatus Brocadiales bacterium]|nr:hypothetical protein [Candidatus Brocadiales bacterium]